MSLALWIAFAAAFAIGIRDFLHAKMLRTLDVSCLLLFALLAVYAGFIQPSLSVQGVRMIADAWLLLLALGSMGVRRPFTLQYMRDQYPDMPDSAEFRHANYVLTGAWSAAFLVMGLADGIATFNGNGRFPWGWPPDWPRWRSPSCLPCAIRSHRCAIVRDSV